MSARVQTRAATCCGRTVGTTRSRVNVFMSTFRTLGSIEYNGGLRINDSLMTVVLHD